MMQRKIGMAAIVSRPVKEHQPKQVDLVGDVQGKDVLIVEDIIDSGGSTIRASEAAHEAGARRIFAFASHALLSGDAAERLMEVCGLCLEALGLFSFWIFFGSLVICVWVYIPVFHRLKLNLSVYHHCMTVFSHIPWKH